MTFRVHMFAFMGPGQVREVEVPKEIARDGSTEQINQAVFHLGQNEHQRSEDHISVSAGDVIEWRFTDDDRASRFFLIELLGFQELTREQFEGMSNTHEGGVPALAGIRLVHGIDPLLGMPSSMKIATIAVLHHLLGNEKARSALIEDSIVDVETLDELQTFVSNAMDRLRMIPRPEPEPS